jgi:PAS domain S-box-containing protein
MNYTGHEVFFNRDDLVVSKTDIKGKLTYANHTFLEVAGYEESEVIGQPHNMIRNPNMPRAVFDLMWTTIAQGKEIFAYVVNSTKSGDHYWVIAHVTPSRENGSITGYHSTRRVPNPQTIKDVIEPLYDQLNSIEKSNPSSKDGLQDSVGALMGILSDKGVSYDEFMASLTKED